MLDESIQEPNSGPSVDWGREKCIRLIDEYKSYPELWNPCHPSYYNKTRKYEVWEHIAQVLGFRSVDDVKKKMDSILASYRRAKLRCKRTNKYGEVILTPSRWYAFERLSFLKDREKDSDSRKKKTKIEPDEDISEESSQPVGDDPLEYSSDCEFNEQDFHIDEGEIETKPEELLAPVQNEETPIKQNSIEHSSEDEFEYFSKYLANKLRNYDKRTNAFVQHEISNIIFKADMGEYTQK